VETVVGIVGPRDLVDQVSAICEQQSGTQIERYPYAHESEAPAIVQANAASVDAWLFTGVVPYTLATDALTRPASYVDYTGPTLLQAFVQLLREGHDITRLSVDTLSTADVGAVLTEANIPTTDVHALAFRPGVDSETIVRFHRRHAAPGSVAITCVSTVYEQLSNDSLPVLRLVPSWDSIRFAFRQLLLVTTNQINENSQVALGLIETRPGSADPTDGLSAAAGALAGTIARYGDGQSLIVTTHGQLAAATDRFRAAPFLQRLSSRFDEVRVGFGIGRSAAEAETLARRALSRARSHGPIAAVASFRNDIDMVLDTEAGVGRQADALEQASIGVIAARVGLSVQTLQRLRGISAEAGDDALTTRAIATRLGIQQRTARRILQRLELAGFADRTGHLSPGTSGRPLTLYRLHL
jgi:hypothetical protein